MILVSLCFPGCTVRHCFRRQGTGQKEVFLFLWLLLADYTCYRSIRYG